MPCESTEAAPPEMPLATEGRLFRDTFENAAVGLAHVSPQGQWLRINNMLSETLGYAASELKQLTFQELTHPDDLGEDLTNVQRMLAGEIQRYSMGKRYLHKSGKIVWAQLTVSLIRTPAGDPDYFISVVEDISERKRLELQIQEGRSQNAVIAENLPCGLAVLNGQLEIQYANLTLANTFACSTASLKGAHVSQLYPMPAQALILQHATQALTDEVVRFQKDHQGIDGTTQHLQVTLAPRKTHDGHISGLVMVVDDVSELVRTQNALIASAKMLQHLSQHDPLTGLPNRALFRDSLQQALATARRQLTRLALVFIDLDKFKPVNDRYGHLMGDRVLQEAAARMRQSVRESDSVARIGGDEFVLLLPLVDSEQDAITVALKVRADLAMPMLIDGHEVNISCSGGVALFPDHASDADQLLSLADSAMYRAKRAGSDQVVVFSPP
ncbi:diguanylate cyclase domain-containing protein [Rhodoferax sp. PAMC 29310]|uniref:diguanylate cyclase domain-containing protein n=1 Tax=Rhodoferax sp. PAMC 29310 TaxID=2822760 RepID=UPI001B33EC2A|nr:diguanylate cyclase [Rhodoferax sp. PAMC 29310]